MAKKDIYQEITNQIIADLEKGTPMSGNNLGEKVF